MKLKCTQENLRTGLTIVGQLVSKNSSLPILNNILINAQEGCIQLVTTNLEIGIKTIIRGKIETPGSFTVDARIFSEYIALLPKETIDMELIENELVVSTQKTQTRIKGFSADEFPLIPEVEKENIITLKTEELKKAINQVLFAASHDEARIELSGVYFQFFNNKLVLAATDSFRLSEKTISLGNTNNQEKKIIVPSRSVYEMNRIISNEEEIQLFVSEGQIAMKTPQTEFVSRVIEGNFPDYTQIIPTKKNTRVVAEKSEFIKSIKTASLFCKPGINDISIVFASNTKEVVVAAMNTQVGENISRLDAEITGEENKGIYNYKFLLEGLNSISTTEAVLELIDQNNPMVVKPKGESNHLYLIMPIRQ